MAQTSASRSAESEDTQPIVYTQKQTPMGLDNYQAGFYYYNGKNVFNMRSYSVAAGTEVKALKVNPSGSSYAYIDVKKEHGTVRVNDLWLAKNELGKIACEGFEPTAICYSADSKRLFVACADDTIRVFDSKSFKERDKFSIGITPTRLDASGNGYYLVASSGATARVINIDGRSVRAELSLKADINGVAFSENGNLMAVLTGDGHCAVYDTRTFEMQTDYEAMGEAASCRFHPENKYMAVVTGQQRIALINLMNERDRDYVESTEEGVNYVNFVKNTDEGIYLVYNTTGSIVFHPVFYLSPNRMQMLTEELKSRMEEWSMRMEGETLEEYNERVNDETRMQQISLFETEIATRMADNLLSMADISLGNYNQELGMLTVNFDNMPSIYLSVPAGEVSSFMEPGVLEFTNSKYCINENDEFELVYTEVINKKTGQTYIFDNTERKSLAFLDADDNFIPLEQLQMSQMEELQLAEIRNSILTEAREKDIISEHTHIDVNTKVMNAVDANGRKITNYQVGVSYTVDESYSAKDDFGPGKFKTEESNAAKAMLEVVKQALEGDMKKYVAAGKKVKIMVTGTADATPFRGTAAYDGCYGDFEREPVYKDGQLSNITVTKATGISDNDQLAYLRAMGVKDYMVSHIPSLSGMDAEYDATIEVSSMSGSQYRRIGVQLTFIDAF